MTFKKLHFVLVAALAMASALPARAADTAEEAKNKQLVLDMWQAVIVDMSPDAVLRYISPDYVQHNPVIAPGRQGLYDAVKILAENRTKPGAKPHTTKRLVHAFADGDLVALTWDLDVADPANPGKTYVVHAFDMFRLKNGMVVEHWDDVKKK
jgi:predicted SnoaL-like aldol condensation-catalyzing enzyme